MLDMRKNQGLTKFKGESFECMGYLMNMENFYPFCEILVPIPVSSTCSQDPGYKKQRFIAVETMVYVHF